MFHADKPAVTVGGKAVEAHALEFSLGTPPDGVSGPLVAVPTGNGLGCAASDYDNLPVKGAVVLVDRGTCPFAQKEDAAAQRGAVAMIVADNVDEQQMGGTLGANHRRQDPGGRRHQVRRHAAARPTGTGHHQAERERPEFQSPQRHRADQDRARPPTW